MRRCSAMIALLACACIARTEVSVGTIVECQAATDCTGGWACAPIGRCVRELDTLAPRLLSVEVRSETELRLSFDEALWPDDAHDLARFRVEPALTLRAIEPESAQTLRLETAMQIPSQGYVLTTTARDAQGNASAAPFDRSSFVGFGVPPETDPPAPIAPSQDAVVAAGTTTLVWSARRGASFYMVELCEDPACLVPVQAPVRVDAPATLLSVSLPEAITYHWRVRADTTMPGAYGTARFDVLLDTIYVYCPAGEPCDVEDGTGSSSRPYRGVRNGLAAATLHRLPRVAIAARGGEAAYNDSLFIDHGVEIVGGYDQSFSDANRDPGAHRTILSSVAPTLVVTGTDPCRIDGLVVRHGGGSDFALVLHGTDEHILIENTRLEEQTSGGKLLSVDTSIGLGPLLRNVTATSGELPTTGAEFEAPLVSFGAGEARFENVTIDAQSMVGTGAAVSIVGSGAKLSWQGGYLHLTSNVTPATGLSVRQGSEVTLDGVDFAMTATCVACGSDPARAIQVDAAALTISGATVAASGAAELYGIDAVDGRISANGTSFSLECEASCTGVRARRSDLQATAASITIQGTSGDICGVHADQKGGQVTVDDGVRQLTDLVLSMNGGTTQTGAWIDSAVNSVVADIARPRMVLAGAASSTAIKLNGHATARITDAELSVDASNEAVGFDGRGDESSGLSDEIDRSRIVSRAALSALGLALRRGGRCVNNAVSATATDGDTGTAIAVSASPTPFETLIFAHNTLVSLGGMWQIGLELNHALFSIVNNVIVTESTAGSCLAERPENTADPLSLMNNVLSNCGVAYADILFCPTPVQQALSSEDDLLTLDSVEIFQPGDTCPPSISWSFRVSANRVLALPPQTLLANVDGDDEDITTLADNDFRLADITGPDDVRGAGLDPGTSTCGFYELEETLSRLHCGDAVKDLTGATRTLPFSPGAYERD